MPRYVLLEHDHPFPHFDLMLEDGPALRTWRLHTWPSAERAIVAEALPPHRPSYLDYEGPISGGRGVVSRRDAGQFSWHEDSPGRVVVMLVGSYAGSLSLESADGAWRATFTPAPDL